MVQNCTTKHPISVPDLYHSTLTQYQNCTTAPSLRTSYVASTLKSRRNEEAQGRRRGVFKRRNEEAQRRGARLKAECEEVRAAQYKARQSGDGGRVCAEGNSGVE
eukprot:724327-Rhodomonas_salina.1